MDHATKFQSIIYVGHAFAKDFSGTPLIPWAVKEEDGKY